MVEQQHYNGHNLNAVHHNSHDMAFRNFALYPEGTVPQVRLATLGVLQCTWPTQ
jgi:hypothetical protein